MHWWCCQITQLLWNNIDTDLSLELIHSIVVDKCSVPFSLTVKVENYNFGAELMVGRMIQVLMLMLMMMMMTMMMGRMIVV